MGFRGRGAFTPCLGMIWAAVRLFPPWSRLGSRMISSARGPVELGRRASPEVAAAAPNERRRSERHMRRRAVKHRKNVGAGKVQDLADAASEPNWTAPWLPSMPDAGPARKLTGAKVASVSGARPRWLGRGSCARRRIHNGPPGSLDGLLDNAAVAIPRRYRPGLRRITCGSIASSVWSRRQKWW